MRVIMRPLTRSGQGILGYSEGASLAATFVLEERRRWEEEGRPRRIKVRLFPIHRGSSRPILIYFWSFCCLQYAIFFAGWPPVRFCEGAVQIVLADESEDIIDVPTCHIVGCNDPYIHGAIALFSMCDEDTATMFDHGKGHTVPRNERTIQELVSAIEGTRKKAASAD
ncbi:hypothetical protein VTO42DRAFT_918 [Malbranchea cinnamomea]